MGDMKTLQRHTNLFESVRVLRHPLGFAGCLYGWQQERNEEADDGDHHQ